MKFPRFCSSLLVMIMVLSGTARAQEKSPAPAPASLEPHLLLAPADFERINAQARAEPWAEKIRADLVQAAEDWPAAHDRKYGLEEWAPPAEGGGWSGDYICPDDGAYLVFSPGHNRCPHCGKEYHGWPTDYVIYGRRHHENANTARDLALAYRLTGEARFAEKARRILLAYAKLYPTLPIHDHKIWPTPNGRSGGRVDSQTLGESDWVVAMAFAYDLVRATLSADERALIERDILRNGSDVIARRERSLGNWTARHNMAHLAVGLMLHDDALVKLALDAEFGIRDEFRRSVTADGVWHEGSWGYHFYVLSALFPAREMAARAGIALPEADTLRKMLDAPLACILPDGSLPNFNDSGFTSLKGYARFYDFGFRLFVDRRYLRIVRDAPRGIEALLWGSSTVGEGALPELGSTVLAETGFATLRAPGTDHVIAVKFGEAGGGHGHFDKLNFISYSEGRIQALDPGSQSYGYKTHQTWDRVTLAHNTVVVDETTQAPATGRLLEWHPGEVASAVRVDAGPVYKTARLERLLVHTAGYTLDVFDVTATDGSPHRIDWIYHNNGRVASPLTLAPYTSLPATSGYQHLSDTRATTSAGTWNVTFTHENSGVRLQMLGAADTTIVLGNGLGPDLAVPVPFALARRRGTEARFITVLEPIGETPRVRSVRLARPGVVAVETTAGLDEISIEAGHYTFTRAPLPVTKP